MLDGMWRGTCAVGGAGRLCWDRDNREQPHTEHTRVAGDIDGGAIVTRRGRTRAVPQPWDLVSDRQSWFCGWNRSVATKATAPDA